MYLSTREGKVKTFLITGGAGFIGANFVELALEKGHRAVVLDALTYAGHLENLKTASKSSHYEFVQGDIRDQKLVSQILSQKEIDVVINFAAESHVDRSIENPNVFIETNVLGVANMLSCSLKYYETLSAERKKNFKYVQVSTDEVFGSLGDTGFFSETTPYAPNSPYSASKAGGDHLVRAWFHTYKLPTITTNCSNNYGPMQYPEKLIPHMINCALQGKALPVYGNGKNVRDWIYVKDHCRGIMLAAENGIAGEAYCFGGNSERNNLNVVQKICSILDKKRPKADGSSYEKQIQFVEDRKGHDWRYAIDDSRAVKELGFTREFKNFEEGLEATINWYLESNEWMKAVLNKKA